MPELPEVETITRQLNQKIKGKTIKSVSVFLPKLVKYPLKKFERLVSGQKIVGVKRRGKLVLIELANGFILAIHLKLSGQLLYNGERGKHTHLIYEFSDGNSLLHNDLRKFGFVKVLAKEEFESFLAKEKLGPEPLSDSFTFDVFKKRLAKKKGKIKIILMNQTFLVGLGNIYANEILFFAKVLPQREVADLRPNEIKKIYEGIKKILTLAIKKRGTSERDYVDAEGQKGKYLKMLKVYKREGESCLVCGNKIKRIKMAGRSSFVCEKCQK